MKRWTFVIGAVLIVLGVFSLLQVGLNVLGIAFRIWWIFWPALLIGAGVWIVLGISRGSSAEVSKEQASVALEGKTEAAVTVRHGAGRLTIAAGAAAGQLLSGSFGGGLDLIQRSEGSRLFVDMRVKDRNVSRYIFGPWNRGWAGLLDWDFTLNPDIPTSLRLETGASETRLSLTDLNIVALHIQTGASSTTVDLPARSSYTKVSIESGAAAVKLRVPQGVAATIMVKSALAGIHVDQSRFPSTAGGYRSRDFEGSANKVEILVETGVGSVDIS
jgi:hypothetical protein